eukprot:3456144-Amphidinium_carterae.1
MRVQLLFREARLLHGMENGAAATTSSSPAPTPAPGSPPLLIHNMELLLPHFLAKRCGNLGL